MAEAPGNAVESVAMLFTDIEGSTRHLHDLGDARWTQVLAEHNRLITEALLGAAGRAVKTEGDSFFIVFPDAASAVRAAVRAQRDLLAHPWPTQTPLTVRMGIHFGSVRPVGDDFIGLAVHEAARLSAVGHGGQILISEAARRQSIGLPDDVTLRSLGKHVVRDFPAAQELHQICHPDLPDAFPSLRTTTATSHNVPTAATALVGRDDKVTEVLQLARTGSQLVTVQGPGGVGKTRLALEVAREALPHFAGGVWFVPLDGLSAGSPVLPEVLARLGFKSDPDRDPVRVLVDGLEGRGRCLIVLDNMEHLLAEGPVVSRLLAEGREITVLATSRERLNLRGERLVELPPLDQDAAVELFNARAQQGPGMVSDATDVKLVERICWRLEGMPLAIELAAGRLNVGLSTLAESLESSFELVGGGGLDLAPRQRAISATVGWSVDLLTASERSALGSLSVFAGGCTSVAAAAVTGSLAAVSALVDKSLLLRRDHRLSMLEPVRQFAAEDLRARGAAGAAEDRHTTWFLDWVDTVAPGLTGPAQAELLDDLDADSANLEVALRRLEVAADPRLLQLAAQLGRYWDVRGHWQRGSQHLEQAVALGPASSWFGTCLHWAGRLANRCGQVAVAEEHQQQALEVLRAAGDPVGAGRCLDALGELARGTGDLAGAAAAYEEALALFHQAGSAVDAAVTRQNQGALAVQRGDLATAETCFLDALGPLQAAGDERRAARASMNLGAILVDQGKFALAARYLNESLEAFNRIGDREGVGAALSNLGHLLASSGHREEAGAPLREALVVARGLGDLAAVGRIVVNLDEAGFGTVELWRDGLAAHRATGSAAGAALCAHRLGLAAREAGDVTTAREMLRTASEDYASLAMTAHQVSALLALAEIAEELSLDGDAEDLRAQATAVLLADADPSVLLERLLIDARLGGRQEREAWLSALAGRVES